MFFTNFSEDSKRKRTHQYVLSCMTLNTNSGEDHQLPTYFPSTHSDRVPLHVEWDQRREQQLAARREEALRQRSAEGSALAPTNPNPSIPAARRQWLKKGVAGTTQRRPTMATSAESVKLPQLTLQQLMKEQDDMAYEAAVLEVTRQQSEKQYTKVLDQTDDPSHGALDHLLKETRQITREGVSLMNLSTQQERDARR